MSADELEQFDLAQLQRKLNVLRAALETMLSWAGEANSWRNNLQDRKSREWQKDYAEATALLTGKNQPPVLPGMEYDT